MVEIFQVMEDLLLGLQQHLILRMVMVLLVVIMQIMVLLVVVDLVVVLHIRQLLLVHQEELMDHL